MSNIEYYDGNESIALAEALQKKAEQEAQNKHMLADDVRKRGIDKYNEVRRRHAIEFLQKIDEKINALSNQTIANLLKALIALGLDIEDEEELEYWINLLVREVLLRLNDYFEQRDVKSLWQQVNNKSAKKDIFNVNYDNKELMSLQDMVQSLRDINDIWAKSDNARIRIDNFLLKIERTLANDLQVRDNKKTRQRQNKNNQSKRKETHSQDDGAFEMLKNKMTAEGIEDGGRYWTEVVSDFEASDDKNNFARNWVVDANKKNEEDIQKINELRGVKTENKRRQEQEERQKQKEYEQQIRQNEQNNQLKHEQERIKNIQNINKEQIDKEFENPKNRKKAEKYAEKKQQKNGKTLDEKDIKMIKMKAVGNKGR